MHIFLCCWIFFVQYLQELIICATHFGTSTLGIYYLSACKSDFLEGNIKKCTSL